MENKDKIFDCLLEELNKQHKKRKKEAKEKLQSIENKDSLEYKRELAASNVIEYILDDFIFGVTKKENMSLDDDVIVFNLREEKMISIFDDIIDKANGDIEKIFAIQAKKLYMDDFANVEDKIYIDIDDEENEFKYKYNIV